MSGVAIQTERQLLNAKLADIADTLRETELQMWNIWMDWQDMNYPETFTIDYPDTFDMRDEHLELNLLMQARSSGVNNKMFQDEISKQVVALVVDDDQIQSKILADMETSDFEVHEMTDPISGLPVVVTDEAQHLALEEMGFKHEGE